MGPRGKVVEPQSQVFGRYRLVESLGAGGMAEVFLAKLEGIEGFERKLAIKRILPHHSRNEGFVEMFKDEARLVSRFSHPNIVQTFEFGKIDDCYYLSMEYVDGVNLAEIMTYHKSLKLQIPLTAIIEIGIQICRGIDYAHRETDDEGEPLGIIHRDLTPHNILVSRKGVVKITDFGIAKASMNTHLTQAGMIKGKVPYMSPEQATGLKLTHVSDIFSIGIVMFEMCTLERLFEGDNDFVTLRKVQEAVIPSIREKRPDVPESLERAILKALARDRQKRYQWASEFEADLTRIKFQLAEAFQAFDLSRFVDMVYQGRRAKVGKSGGGKSGKSVRPGDEANAGDGETAPVVAGDPARIQRSLSDLAAGLSDVKDPLPISGSEVGGGGGAVAGDDQKTVLMASQPSVAGSGVLEGASEPAEEGSGDVEEGSEAAPKETGVAVSSSPTVQHARFGRRPGLLVGVVSALLAAVVAGVWVWSGRTGSIVVEVDPPDAVVYFDGVKVGEGSPVVETGLKSGKAVVVRVSKDGYQDFTHTIVVKGRVRQRLPVHLARKASVVEVNTVPPGATVYMGGYKTGWKTPCRLELPPGNRYELMFVLDGFETRKETLVVDSSERRAITLELKPGRSTVPGREEPGGDDPAGGNQTPGESAK